MTNEQFTAALREYSDTVYRVALNCMKNPHNAEDVAQEVFLRLYRAAIHIYCIAQNLEREKTYANRKGNVKQIYGKARYCIKIFNKEIGIFEVPEHRQGQGNG